MADPTIVWFRQDLRLEDNPAFAAALERGLAVLPVYIHAQKDAGRWAMGGAAQWWLHHALADLDNQLRERGLRLYLLRGEVVAQLAALAESSGAGALYANRHTEPFAREQERGLEKVLSGILDLRLMQAVTLYDPEAVLNQQGEPYKVFTPFWKAVRPRGVARPEPLPREQIALAEAPADALDLDALELLPRVRWDAGLARSWKPVRAEGLKRLRAFVDSAVNRYPEERDFPAIDGTSLLSPYLHFGQLGSREVWHACGGLNGANRPTEAFLRQLGWRDFAHAVLYHFPHTDTTPLQKDYEHFPWEDNQEALACWRRGRTGYPIVDAAMRQLWETGWMHNRLRMIVASFLVKDLRIHWLEGAAWFWDTLVDADLANNTLGWQWAGGCGADAAPYFRVFNPMLQGKKFDAGGCFVRRYCPELARLPDKFLHAPWEAPTGVLREAGVQLGEDYPEPMVDHGQARQRALHAFEKLKALRRHD